MGEVTPNAGLIGFGDKDANAQLDRCCYDCGEEHEYSDDEIYEYFDAELGGRFAFNCKSCGFTNSW